MLHRRDAMLRLGQLGGACALPGLLQARDSAPRRGSADSCIYLFLWGGPPQHDTFDLKPDAPAEIRGEFRPVRTNVPGIDICEQLPKLARLADKYALVRSLTHRSDNHEPSVYHMLTGRVPPRPPLPLISSRLSYSNFSCRPACPKLLNPYGRSPEMKLLVLSVDV